MRRIKNSGYRAMLYNSEYVSPTPLYKSLRELAEICDDLKVRGRIELYIIQYVEEDVVILSEADVSISLEKH